MANGEKKSGFLKALIIALVVMIVLILGWNLIFPILGIAVAVTAAAWGVLLATIIFLAIGALLFYFLSGMGIFIICGLGFAWVVAALVFFPFFFPIFIPLIILLFFIGYVRRKEDSKE